MKRLFSAALAAIISLVLVFSVFGGVVPFADAATEVESLLHAAGAELYGLNTLASANCLRDCYFRLEAALTAGKSDKTAETDALAKALESLVPLNDYRRSEPFGFDEITADDADAMEYTNGFVSSADGYITLGGSDTLRYCNAAENGIVGNSPFGIATDDCDGFVIKIDTKTEATVDIEIGRRGSADDCSFGIPDVLLTAGEKYYLFPFSSFGDLPLDGTLNYISLTFKNTDSVVFGDLHAAAETAGNVQEKPHAETPIQSLSFNNKKYCKILQKGTNLALTILTKDEGDGLFVYKENDPDNIGQLWQICADNKSKSRFRIISKLTGQALMPIENPTLNMTTDVPSFSDTTQEWAFSYNKAKGFSIYIPRAVRISYAGTRLRLTTIKIPAKYFDIVEVDGSEWNQVWSDEFDTIDRSVWRVMDRKNRGPTEPMFNRDSPKNLYIDNGNLVIKSIIEEYKGYHATSAYISTGGNVAFGYGRFEIRAKMPCGTGIWPAFWMMGEDDTWSRCGEIDVVEMVGDGEAGNWEGDRCTIGTIHYTDESGINHEVGGWRTGYSYNDENLSEEYHTYAVEWEKDQIRWYVDDMLYLSFNIDTPERRIAFQENPMYLILNNSIRGPGDNQLPEGLPDETFFFVDYVRYFKEASAERPADTVPYRYELTKPDFEKRLYSPCNGAAVSSEHDKLFYSNYANILETYDMKNLSETSYLQRKGGNWSMSCAISGDGKVVVDGRKSGLLTATDTLDVKAHRQDVFPYFPTLALNSDGSVCYVGGTSNESEGVDYCKSFHVYETAGLTELHSELTKSWVDSIAVAKNDNYAYGCYDGSVRVRSPQNEDIGSFNITGRVIDLVFSNDSKKLYAIDETAAVYVYDVDTKRLKTLVTPIYDEVFKLAVSPDGSKLAAACGDSCARVYETATGRLLYRACIGGLVDTGVSFSLDGKLLAVTGTDGKIGIYRADDGLPLVRLASPSAKYCWYITIGFSSDSSTLMAVRQQDGEFDSSVLGWKLPKDLVSDAPDFTALDNLPYYDEMLYTPDSYSAYAAELSQARHLRENRYATAGAVKKAVNDVNEAAKQLRYKSDFIKGDFDKDGAITVNDALMALRFASRMATPTEDDITIGDVDGDGAIMVTDSLLILRVAARISDKF